MRITEQRMGTGMLSLSLPFTFSPFSPETSASIESRQRASPFQGSGLALRKMIMTLPFVWWEVQQTATQGWKGSWSPSHTPTQLCHSISYDCLSNLTWKASQCWYRIAPEGSFHGFAYPYQSFPKITLGIFASIPFHFIPEQHSTAARFPWNTREQAQVTDSPPGCSWWWICVLGRSSARHHSWNWRLVHRHHRCQWTLQHKHTAQHAAG